MNLVFKAERWFAWHPVRTCDAGWQWRKTIFRRNVVEIEKKKMHWQYFYNDPLPVGKFSMFPPADIKAFDADWCELPLPKSSEKTVH